MDPIIVRVPPKVTQMLEIQVLFPNPSKQQMTSTNCEKQLKEKNVSEYLQMEHDLN